MARDGRSYVVHIIDEFDGVTLPLDQDLPSYSTVCLGGTFDRIHRGHLLLLATAAAVVQEGGQILVGVSDGPLLSSKLYSELIRPLELRQQSVIGLLEQYLEKRGFHGVKVKVFSIYDPYGPSITADLDGGCLIVSTETISGGHRVNLERRLVGHPVIDLVVVPLLKDDAGDKVSSTQIREEESQSGHSDIEQFG